MNGKEPPDAAADGPPSRSRRTLVLSAVAGLLVLALGCGVSYVMGIGPLARSAHAAHRQAAPVAPVQPIYVETPEMLANLDAGSHRIAFAKLQCRIEVDRPADAALVTSAMPRIVDMAETYLRAVRPEELRSDTGAFLLREAILNRLAVAVPGAAVSDVLFEELLVQ